MNMLNPPQTILIIALGHDTNLAYSWVRACCTCSRWGIGVFGVGEADFPSSFVGAQWPSGRVLDSRPKGRGFEPHRRHCVVVLEQDTLILA